MVRGLEAWRLRKTNRHFLHVGLSVENAWVPCGPATLPHNVGVFLQANESRSAQRCTTNVRFKITLRSCAVGADWLAGAGRGEGGEEEEEG